VTAIESLQAAMVKLPQADLPTRHWFADGMYLRELPRPADTTIVGKVHRKEHFYIVLTGEVTVVSDQGRERIKAPRILVCRPGTKRAVYAHVDSICITVHRTFETDLEALERELVEEDSTSLYGPGNTLRALESP
jgi:hypothetical protein